MTSPYRHRRLNLATDAIRLVRLVQGAEGQPIQCEVFETYLHQTEGVPYEALSYVWGAREATRKVWLDGYPVTVTENLYQALDCLRRPEEDRLLWVDAICIDQSHDAERGHQVGQMRLVYQNAHNVIIWFGASSEHIDSLFDWMNRLDRQVLNIPRPYTICTWQYGWDWTVWISDEVCPKTEITQALRQLLQREWFSRIWVIQEAAVARSATIACGRNRVHSRTFALMPSLLSIECTEREQARLDLMPGLLRNTSGWTSSYDWDLGMLLRKFGESEASDPRDVIYALIGLCQDAYTSDILRPDYEISLQQVIQNTVEYLLTRSGDLHKNSYTGVLPDWNLAELLHALQDLPTHTFYWAMRSCEDGLLADLLNCQVEKKDEPTIRKFVTYGSFHGPLVTISIKKGNLELFKRCMQFPGVDLRSPDKDGYTPQLMANKHWKRNPIFAECLLEKLGTEDNKEDWKLLDTFKVGILAEDNKEDWKLLDTLKVGILAVFLLIVGSWAAIRYLGMYLRLWWWRRRVSRRWA